MAKFNNGQCVNNENTHFHLSGKVTKSYKIFTIGVLKILEDVFSMGITGLYIFEDGIFNVMERS